MPEPPDFDQIAREILLDCPLEVGVPETVVEWARNAVIERLREVWNARGAADIEAVKGADIAHKDPLDQRPDTDDIVRALMSLDR